jgi:hypothetical protein
MSLDMRFPLLSSRVTSTLTTCKDFDEQFQSEMLRRTQGIARAVQSQKRSEGIEEAANQRCSAGADGIAGEAHFLRTTPVQNEIRPH